MTTEAVCNCLSMRAATEDVKYGSDLVLMRVQKRIAAIHKASYQLVEAGLPKKKQEELTANGIQHVVFQFVIIVSTGASK